MKYLETRRYGALQAPTSSSCGGLVAFAHLESPSGPLDSCIGKVLTAPLLTHTHCNPVALLATRNLAKVLQEESRISGFRADATQIFLRKSNRESRSSVERLSSGSVQPCRFLFRVSRLWFVPVISVSAH